MIAIPADFNWLSSNRRIGDHHAFSRVSGSAGGESSPRLICARTGPTPCDSCPPVLLEHGAEPCSRLEAWFAVAISGDSPTLFVAVEGVAMHAVISLINTAVGAAMEVAFPGGGTESGPLATRY